MGDLPADLGAIWGSYPTRCGSTIGAVEMQATEWRLPANRPPLWRTFCYLAVAIFASLVSASFSPLIWRFMREPEQSGWLQLGGVVTLFTALAFPIVLFWRHRHPHLLTAIAGVVALIVPIGNMTAFLMLATMLGRTRSKRAWQVTALVCVTSAVVVIRDALAQPIGASLQKSIIFVGTDLAVHKEASLAVTILAALIGPAITIGAGLLVQARRIAAAESDAVKDERAKSSQLGDEVARQQERERISREVHDALGHRLSLLSLHANAMEATAGDDPKIAQSAKLVSQSASAAMADLRSLLDVLNSPMAEADGLQLPLSELANVVQDSLGAGESLNSSIMINDPNLADPALARAVYRIVQEALTNARKHAPGEPVLLTVNGGPGDGITIDVRNRYRGGWGERESGTSRGLAGLAERAELLGGSADYGLDGEDFRVHVELPWRPV